jgi:hypothetical protein
VLQLVVLHGQVLVLVQEIVDLELCLRKGHLLATELVLQFDQLVLKLDASLAFIVEVSFKAILRLPKLLPLILEHELDFAEAAVIVVAVCMGEEVLLADGLL